MITGEPHTRSMRIRGQRALEIASYMPAGGWYTPEDIRRSVPTLGPRRPYRALIQLHAMGVLDRRKSPEGGGRVEYRKRWSA